MSFLAQFQAYGITPAEVAVKPVILTCANWGARPPKAGLTLAPGARAAVVHHMATQNRPRASSPKEALALACALAKTCQDSHMDTDYLAPGGAEDTGQHLTNTIDGLLLEGRHGSADALLDPTKSFPQGAQCYGYNPESVGMEHEGVYTNCIPNRTQLRVSLTVLTWLCLTRGWDSHVDTLGHRDRCATACPGDAYYAILPLMRDLVRESVLWAKAHKLWSPKQS